MKKRLGRGAMGVHLKPAFDAPRSSNAAEFDRILGQLTGAKSGVGLHEAARSG